MQLGREAEAASAKLLTEAKELAPHLRRNPASWPTIRHSRFEAFASRGLGELPARLLLELHDHGAACVSNRDDPYLAPELSAILEAMRKSHAHAGRPVAEQERKRVERAIEPLEMLVRVQMAPFYHLTIAKGRAELEKDAANKGCAIVEVPGYPEWRKRAEIVEKRTQALLSNSAARPAFKRWPDHEQMMAKKLIELEGWLRQDDNHPARRAQRLQKQKSARLQAERAPPAPVPPRPKPQRRRQRQPPTNTGRGGGMDL